MPVPRAIVVAAVFLPGALVPSTLLAGGPPVRLQVRASSAAVPPGAEVTLTVRVLDASDAPATVPAGMTLPFRLVATGPDRVETVVPVPGAAAGGEARWPAGGGEVKAQFRPTRPGMWRVAAKSGNLVGATCVFEALGEQAKKAAVAPVATAIAPASHADAFTRRSGGGGFGAGTLRSVASRSVVRTTRPERTVADRTAVEEIKRSNERSGEEPAPVDGSARKPFGLFFNVDSLQVRANGKAAAQVDVHVTGTGSSGLEKPIDIVFSAKGASVEPNPLRVEAGARLAQATLTSQEVGKVHLALGNADPEPSEPVEGLPETIEFIPPIEKLVIEVPESPKVGSTQTLSVALKTADGVNVAAEKVRHVDLAASGPARLRSSGIDIPEGSAAGRTEFDVTGSGPITFKAMMADLPDATAETVGSSRFMVFALASVTGLGGGGIAMFTAKRRPRRLRVALRIAIGGAMGFLLYWLATVGAAGTFAGGAVAHTAGAVAIGIVGGWAGTGVLAAAAKAMGVGGAKESAPS
jgi:hypothetical protein